MQTTIDNLETYPFVDQLKPIEYQIRSYAEYLKIDATYNALLKAICEDTTIRLGIDVVNLEGISPKQNTQAFKCIDNILNVLI